MIPTFVQNIMNNNASNCSDTCFEIYENNMCLRKCKPCKSKVKQVFLKVSPIGCRTMETSKNTSNKTYKSLNN